MEKIKVIIEWTENNYGAASEDVLGCVATHKTLSGVKEAYASALKFHLEGMQEDGDEIPDKLQGDYELEFELTVPALLNALEGKTTLSALSEASGINIKQLSHYKTGERYPRKEQRERIISGLHRIAYEFLSVM